MMESSTVTIDRETYEKLIADSLFAQMAGDFIEDLPIDMAEIFEEDPRFRVWVKMVNPEWYKEMYGD